jgi:lipid-A-disaccharide synthase
MQFLISAGEASGDNYGAQLIEALREIAPGAEFFGMGGERMHAAGCDLQVHANDVAVVGLLEVVAHLPAIRRRFNHLVNEARQRRPDAAVLVDFPDFNLRLARELHALGIPVFYFISPQLWAWRTGRVEQIKQYVRKMIVIFPFEQEFYRGHGVDVSYVGHPLAFQPLPQVSREEFAAQYKLDPAKQWLAILPGSRRKELRLNLPVMLEALKLLQKQGSDFEYLLPVASTLDSEWVRYQFGPVYRTIKLTENAQATVMLSRAAVVASGTATVESALTGTPFVVVYRLSWLTWLLGRRLVKLENFAMPNLIAGKKIVPELIQSGFTAEAVVRELNSVLPDGPARSEMQKQLAGVKQKLHQDGQNASPALKAAREILAAMGRRGGAAQNTPA